MKKNIGGNKSTPTNLLIDAATQALASDSMDQALSFFEASLRVHDPEFRIAASPPASTVQGLVTLIRQAYAMRESVALHDPLTGLWNRAALPLSLETAWQSARRNTTAFSLCLLDIDGFKSFNDQQGHLAGDALLEDLARHLAQACRGSDIVGRWGGDEFYLVLPDTALEGARHLAQRCLAWNKHPAPTLSMGVTSVAPSLDTPFDGDAIIHKTDKALYAAKAAGGAQCISLA